MYLLSQYSKVITSECEYFFSTDLLWIRGTGRGGEEKRVERVPPSTSSGSGRGAEREREWNGATPPSIRPRGCRCTGVNRSHDREHEPREREPREHERREHERREHEPRQSEPRSGSPVGRGVPRRLGIERTERDPCPFH